MEGKYDKIKLASLVDGVIIETSGFHIFKDPEQMRLIRRLADTNGIIILTDSDAAGFVIRNHLTGAIDNTKIKQAYIPDIYGKEKRKVTGSKEGKLGVEGVPKEVVLDALKRAGATFATDTATVDKDGQSVTKAELFALGITGGSQSAEKRKWLLRTLDLPERMTTNAMLRVINETMDHDAFLQLAEQCNKFCNSTENLRKSVDRQEIK